MFIDEHRGIRVLEEAWWYRPGPWMAWVRRVGEDQSWRGSEKPDGFKSFWVKLQIIIIET